MNLAHLPIQMVIFHGYVSLRVDDIHEGSIYVFLWFFTSYYLLTGTTCISIVDRSICNLFIDIYIYINTYAYEEANVNL